MTTERIKAGHYYVLVRGERIGHAWKGCGGWAGSLNVDGISATGRTMIEVARRLAKLKEAAT